MRSAVPVLWRERMNLFQKMSPAELFRLVMFSGSPLAQGFNFHRSGVKGNRQRPHGMREHRKVRQRMQRESRRRNRANWY